jgi:KDO2-lipid IV(A) lauroyltransferase
MAQRFAALGYPSHTIAAPTKDPRLTAYIDRIRTAARVQTIWRGQGSAIAKMEAALDRNEVVGLLIDQDTRTKGVWVDFFGKPAFTPRIVGDLALRRGTPVMSSFVFRRPDGGLQMRLARFAPPTPTGDFEADSTAYTQLMTTAIEQAIREAPHTWVWIHQRWKTKPAQAQAQTQSGPAAAAG